MAQWAGVILAAGLGRRLTESGIAIPKPLAPVLGEKTLLDLASEALYESGVKDIYCITNSHYFQTIRNHVAGGNFPSIEILERNTRSAFHTLMTIQELQGIQNFIVLNVDSTISSKFILRAVQDFQRTTDTVLVYGYTDDDGADQSPLFIEVDHETQRVLALGDNVQRKRFVTSGMYLCSSEVFPIFDEARRRSIITLRDFLGFALQRCNVVGTYVPDSVDVDTAADLLRAQTLYGAGQS